ncbi:MAG: GNVR domain-containing protein, partial [Cyanobacteria bacterium P01_F01_bin.42]
MKGFHLSLPKVIVRRWRTFLLSGTATALVFALGYLAQPIRYEAFGVYTPKPTGPDSEQNTGQRRPSLLRQTVDILLLRDNNLTPEALAIKDDEILQAVIKELEIRDWGGNPASPRSLRRRIRLSNDDRDGAVRVSLHDPTPELAKQIIDRLMAGYVEYYAGQTPEATISVTSVIQPQLIKANTLRKQNQKALYQIQLGSTQLQPESTRTGDQTIDLKAIEISVQQQISTIDADLATLRQVQEKSSGAQTTMVRQFISLAEVRKQLLNRLRETLNMPRDDQSLSTQLELLERQGLTLAKELTLTQNQYTRFLERQQTNWSITQSTQPQVRILSAAILPAQGTRPFRPWFIVLGLCSSVGLGTLTCLLRERQDSSLLSLSDIYAQAQLPILGLIPKFSDQELLTQTLARQQTSELQESSPVMESYRQSIEHLSRGSLERIPQVLAFMSVSVDEGKSLTVANLAYIFAKSGKKVLLLEADLYEPQQPQI